MSESGTRSKSNLENIKLIVDIVSGIAVPVILGLITIYLSRQHDLDAAVQEKRLEAEHNDEINREQQARNAQLILGIGPFLLDADARKIKFGTAVLAYYPDLPEALVNELQALNRSSDPTIADSAGAALAGSPTSDSQDATPPKGIAPEASGDARDHWMVYIYSGKNVEALQKRAQDANARLQSKNITLKATVVGPGPLAPAISGVVVGDNLPFDQARQVRDAAHAAGFLGAYIIRSPAARASSQ